MNRVAPSTVSAPVNAQASIAAAVASGLPQPRTVVSDGPDPFIALHFGVNDTEAVNAWAKFLRAKVGHTDWTYGDVDDDGDVIGAPCHGYGTAANDSVYGEWLGARVGLGCEVLGPHPRTV
jgi:hypothetical protein